MTIAEALRIIQALADGQNPISGGRLPEGSPYQHPDVVRALFTAVHALTSSTQRTSRSTSEPANRGQPWTAIEDKQFSTPSMPERPSPTSPSSISVLSEQSNPDWSALAETFLSPRYPRGITRLTLHAAKQLPMRPETPNHALQRTGAAVTPAVSCLRLSPTTQRSRQPRPSLSLGSLDVLASRP